VIGSMRNVGRCGDVGSASGRSRCTAAGGERGLGEYRCVDCGDSERPANVPHVPRVDMAGAATALRTQRAAS
jgi:hypothetical protein